MRAAVLLVTAPGNRMSKSPSDYFGTENCDDLLYL